MRIVSLLPSATEIICSLGLADQLVGVTHECDFPLAVKALPRVTRTLIPVNASSGEIDTLVRERLRSKAALYTLDMPVLERLRPDLIVTQALCDVCAVAEDEVRDAACSLPGNPRVVNLEPERLSEVFDAIRAVGRATDRAARANDVVAGLEARVERVASRTATLRDAPRTAFIEWLDPPFSCGHWNPELVRLAGGNELLGHEGRRSRTLDWAEVVRARPEAIAIACCGFSLERTLRELHVLESVPGWHTLPAVQQDGVIVIDGSQYFSRPGPRLVDSLEILAHGLHPQLHPLADGLPSPIRFGRDLPAAIGTVPALGARHAS
jgi:iron complex transport system substrate-binding protein